MTFCMTRGAVIAAMSVAASLSLLNSLALAQSETKSSDENSHIAIVKGNDVYVRCGAAESYYTFAKLNEGDMVKVTGEKFEWSRVMAIGPAFDQAFGFIRYTKGEAGRFRLAADGKSGVTLGKIDIIAPNFDAKNNPKDSWKALVRLEADQTLRVIETIETDKETIHKVSLPPAAQGWVSTAHLETATPEQAKQWEQTLADYNRNVADRLGKAASKENTTRTAKNTSANTTPAPKGTESTASSAKQAEPATTPDVKLIPVTENTTATSTETIETTSPTLADAAAASAASTVKTPEPKRLPTLDDLEAALKKLQREPIETAEVTPLGELYLDLAARSGKEPRTVRYATGRAEQLQVWADLQKKRAELDSVRTRAKMSAEETIAVQKALERSAEYVAVGRVAASTIYDGNGLPKLLRLQDPSNGRTVAYLQLDEQYEAANLIGNLVGIVGEKSYDGSMRLNIVEPKRVDLLMPEERAPITVIAPTDRSTP